MAPLLRPGAQLLSRQLPALRRTAALAPAGQRRSVQQQAAYSQEGRLAQPAPKFTVYKPQTAVTFKVIPPQWVATGQNGDVYAVERPGVYLLEFANSKDGPGTKPGDRRYDWENKRCKGVKKYVKRWLCEQSFALSSLELDGILHVEEDGKDLKDGGGKEVRYFHDPGKGTPEEGLTTKGLNFVNTPKGDYLSLNVNEKKDGLRSQFSVAISKAERRILGLIHNELAPYLLGFAHLKSNGYNMSEKNQVAAEAPY